jgi:sugar phosphate isomerase/epimerase
MKFAMCNEFCDHWPLEDAMRLAADTGYDGIEIAPYTLAPHVAELDATQRREVREMAARHNLAIAGIHWLLVKPEGLHMTTPDDAVRAATFRYFEQLIDFCGDIGGDNMIVGSPKQRDVAPGDDPQAAWERAVAFFSGLAPRAADRGVTICVEPLGREHTNFITTAAQAIDLIHAVGHPSVRLILDCKAKSDQSEPIPEIIAASSAELAHFHANDDSLGYPGTGTLDFPSILKALDDVGYDGWVSVEVFDFKPPPQVIAGEALAHLRASQASG